MTGKKTAVPAPRLTSLITGIWKTCNGPGISPMSEKCLSKKADSVGGHYVEEAGDGKPYNGIRNWRCSECFEEHRRRVRLRNDKGGSCG